MIEPSGDVVDVVLTATEEAATGVATEFDGVSDMTIAEGAAAVGAVAEPVEDPEFEADGEVAVRATSVEVAILNEVTVGSGDVGEEALLGGKFAVEAILGKGGATGATSEEVASVGDWAD